MSEAQLDSAAGKKTVDELMAQMNPEQQAQFKAALASDKPVHIHMGKDGKISLGEEADAAADAHPTPVEEEKAPEAPVELKKEEPKVAKVSKIDQKRQQIFRERMQRKMGEKTKDGTLKTQQQALQEIQREDYDAMPLEKKFARLETIVSQSFQNLAQEVVGLNQSHISIADAFDINYRAMQKIFHKLGVTDEEQKVFIDAAQKEVIEEKQKAAKQQAEARMAANKAAADAREKAAVEAETKAPAHANGEAPEAPAHPTEATVFGG